MVADFIQPGLIQLQPNLEDFMDTLEPLQGMLCKKYAWKRIVKGRKMTLLILIYLYKKYPHVMQTHTKPLPFLHSLSVYFISAILVILDEL